MKSFLNIFRSSSSKTVSKASQSAPDAYWSLGTDQLLSAMKTTNKGLTQAEADGRLKQYGLNALDTKKKGKRSGAVLGPV